MAVGDEAEQGATEARVAELEVVVGEQRAKVAELTALVAKQAAQIEVLTELLNRNSKNSHLPPSSDGPGSGGGAAAGRRRPKSGRKRGGQKGHRGSYRELLPVERVDTFIDLFPDVCLGCACRLPQVVDVAACRYQQLELRDHRPHLTEWRRHEGKCERCGACTRAAYDSAQIPSSAFGPCLTAVVAMLTGAYHLSRRKTQRLLSELFVRAPRDRDRRDRGIVIAEIAAW